MCGIAGIYYFETGRSVEPATLDAMCKQLEHRGPDSRGKFTYNSIGLAAQRLSVIDIVAGQQPILNETGTKAIVLNGTIYNYRALRQSLIATGHVFSTSTDTEVVLHAYEQYGLQCLSFLRGVFAFAIADGDNGIMFIARDHFGVKPLYYHVTDERLLFASEAKALLVDTSVPRAVSREALLEYAAQGFVRAPLTLFHGIYKLPPGCYLTLQRKVVKVTRYWKLSDLSTIPRASFHDAAARIADLTRKAVAEQVCADVPVGLFLSGGVDSSSLLGGMVPLSDTNLTTFTIGFRGPYATELDRAERIANVLGVRHISRLLDVDTSELLPSLIWHLDEPLGDSSYVATFLAAQLASESVKVVLSGTGGDELFGGYRRYLAWPLIVALEQLPQFLRRSIRLPGGAASRRDLRYGTGRALIQRALNRLASAIGPLGVYGEFVRLLDRSVLTCAIVQAVDVVKSIECEPRDNELYSVGLRGLQEYDLHHSLTDSLLLLTDKMCMACNLEARVPLLDLDLAEYALGLPARYKAGPGGLRIVQREALKKLLPPEASLPHEKHGFGWPFSALIRTTLNTFVRDWLSESRLRREGFFDPGMVDAMIRDHCEGVEDFGDELLALVTFELWHSVFIEGDSTTPWRQ